MTTLAEVNKKLEEMGRGERLVKSKRCAGQRRYFYFTGGSSHMWPQSAIHVSNIDYLTVEDVLEEFELLKRDV